MLSGSSVRQSGDLQWPDLQFRPFPTVQLPLPCRVQGVVSFDWANHENSYRSRAWPGIDGGPVYPDTADMLQQARRVKAKNNATKVFV